MPKPIQVIVEDDIHKRFKLWCDSRGKQMAEFLRDIIMKCIEGMDPEEVIKAALSIESCTHVELTTASGHVIRLPIPNSIEQEGDHKVITVPDDTSDEDLALIGTIDNSIVKTNKTWKTEIPLEVVNGGTE